MSLKHTNYRELYTVLLVLYSFAPIIKGKEVQIFSDNITTVAYINHLGGSSPELDHLMRSIWMTAHETDVTLCGKYLQGQHNWQVDRLSRSISTYEWKLHHRLF